MELRSILLAAGAVGLLGFACVDSTPPEPLIKEIEKVITARFADASAKTFGVTRLGEPYNSHRYGNGRLMKAEIESEARMIAKLEESGWNAVVYTTSPPNVRKPTEIVTRGLFEEPAPAILGRSRALGRLHGPAFLVEPSAELPMAGRSSDLEKWADEVGRGQRSAFAYKGWSFLARKVFAEETCRACHQDISGKPVEVGTVIGYYLMGFKKKGGT